jgi:hypothetical protein
MTLFVLLDNGKSNHLRKTIFETGAEPFVRPGQHPIVAIAEPHISTTRELNTRIAGGRHPRVRLVNYGYATMSIAVVIALRTRFIG